MQQKIHIPGIDTYYGGKSGAGTYQTIINQLPPHIAYCELFLGGGAIFRYKLLAQENFLNDKDADLIEKYTNALADNPINKHCNFSNMDFIKFLKHPYLINSDLWLILQLTDTLSYVDAPYIIESRKTQRKVYKHDEMTVEDHVFMLETLKQLPSMIAISHYPHPVYDRLLASWRKIQYTSTTRGGSAIENLYMNYPEPTELHDYRYLGNDFRERERIQRMVKRHVARLKNMPALQRQAIIKNITENV